MLPFVLLLFASAALELYQQGVTAIQRGAPGEALPALRQAVQLEPDNAQFRKALGVASASQELYREAEEHFGAACRLDPSLSDVCYYHARALYALNRFGPALHVLEKVRVNDVRVHAAMAQSLDALGRAAEAEEYYRKACLSPVGTAAPPEPPCMLYGVFLFRQGRLNDATKQLENAAKQNPRSARAQFELGRALYQAGRVEKAALHLQEAVTLGHGEAAELLLAKARRRLTTTPPAQ